MKILVRLPNWLGDMVMSTAFLNALSEKYPSAKVDIVVKKGLDTLVDFIPGINRHYIFNKTEWPGLTGAYRFGKTIRQQEHYDLFFCLPDSFSSAVMGWATRAKVRVGFKKELRSFLLSKAYARPAGKHRVEEYVSLLEQYTGEQIRQYVVDLKRPPLTDTGAVIINFNSEAASRRMPIAKATSILNEIANELPDSRLFCIGSEKDKAHVEAILMAAHHEGRGDNFAGQTNSLADLVKVIASGSVMFSTDSGPAHVANALGLPVVVTFGAGNENNTAPFNKKQLRVIRLGELPCEPCLKNVCQFGTPKCLELLETKRIVEEIKNFYQNKVRNI